MQSKLGLCIAVTCPRALGRRQCSPRAMGPGASRRQRRRDAWARSKSMRLRARDWLVAIASNKALPLSASRHITAWYSWSAQDLSKHPSTPTRAPARSPSPYLYLSFIIIIARSKVTPPMPPSTTPRVETSTLSSPPIAPAETLAPLRFASSSPQLRHIYHTT